MDTVRSKMEDVAKKCHQGSILSGNLKNATGSTLARDAPSILRLTYKTSKTFWNDSGGADPPSSHALRACTSP
jgi:hypothetical protein